MTRCESHRSAGEVSGVLGFGLMAGCRRGAGSFIVSPVYQVNDWVGIGMGKA